MNQNRTARAPKSATPIDLIPGDQVPQEPGYDAQRYGVEDGWARDQQLQLRPTEHEGLEHPDRRPCPPWCAGARYPDHEHEIEAAFPTSALHMINGVLTSRASLYRGKSEQLPSGDRVESAVVLSDITQRGQAQPVISLSLRTWDRKGRLDQERLDQHLRLTVEDATELVTVLTYLLRLTRA